MKNWQQRLLYMLVTLNIAVQLGDVSTWVIAACLLLVCWRWLADLLRLSVPSKWVSALFSVLGAIGIYLDGGGSWSLPSASSLLLLLVSAKTMEIRGYRDIMMVTYLCLLLLMTKLLQSQNVMMTAFMFFDVFAILALLQLYHLPTVGHQWSIKRSLKMLAGAMPVVVVLFVLFPRMNLRLFHGTAEQSSSQVGFAGNVRMGSGSSTGRSPGVAFRAFFRSGYQPPSAKLYWRGAVLSVNSGLNWDPDDAWLGGATRRFQSDSLENLVEVMNEQAGPQWLFTLEYPIGISSTQGRSIEVDEREALTFHLRQPLGERETYLFTFEPSAAKLEWDSREITKNLTIAKPEGRLADLVWGWSAQNPTLQQKVDLIREFFVTKPFAYTLSPPRIENLEEFLFDTRLGYCEHFAGATASLLRLLKVPARVVIGYQGGTSSLMGDYLIVNNQDAHAWVEYFDREKQTWVRLDPTGWVAEDRLILGSQEYLSRQRDPGLFSASSNLLERFLGPRALRWVARGRLILDQAEIWWVTLLVRYDYRYQQELFNKIGFGNVTRLMLFSLTLVALIVLGFFVGLWWRRRLKWQVDPAQKFYRDLLRRLERSGFQSTRTAGPLTTAEKAMSHFPQAKEQIGEIFSSIIAARYGSASFTERDEAELRRKLRRLELESATERAA